jgi:hypothetical protein
MSFVDNPLHITKKGLFTERKSLKLADIRTFDDVNPFSYFSFQSLLFVSWRTTLLAHQTELRQGFLQAGEWLDAG